VLALRAHKTLRGFGQGGVSGSDLLAKPPCVHGAVMPAVTAESPELAVRHVRHPDGVDWSVAARVISAGIVSQRLRVLIGAQVATSWPHLGARYARPLSVNKFFCVRAGFRMFCS
jgi:hypothetical protein